MEPNINQNPQPLPTVKPEPIPTPQPIPSAPLTPETPKQPRKLKWTYLLIFVLLLVVLGLLGFIFMSQKQTPAPTPTPEAKITAVPTSIEKASSSADTTDWKTYTNAVDGYSVKFPDDVFVRLNCPDEGLLLQPRTPEDADIDEDKVLANCGRDGFFLIEFQTSDKTVEAPKSMQGLTVTKEVTTLGNQPADRYTIEYGEDYPGQFQGVWRQEIIAKKGNKTYLIRLGNKKYLDTFNTMLTTFEFN